MGMSRKTVLPFALSILALIAVAGLGFAASGAAGFGRTVRPDAAGLFAAEMLMAPARLSACDMPDGSDRISSRDGAKERKGRLAIPTSPGTECARGSMPNRILQKAIFLEPTGYPVDIRLPVAINRQILSHRTVSPLAVAMPNPRSPPIAPLTIPRGAAL